MNIKIILSFLLLIVLVSTALLYYKFGIDHYCNNLKKIANDDILVSKIWKNINSLSRHPSLLAVSGKSAGLVYVQNVPGYLNIDWEELNIPLRHATIEIIGDEIDYKNLDLSKAKEVRIGYGYRKHLVFKVEVDSAVKDIESKEVESLRYDLKVECR